MHRFIIISTLAFSIANTTQALAHPGHGNEQLANTPAHYLLDPFHAIWTIGMVAALVLLIRPARRSAIQQLRLWNGRQRSE